MTEGDLERNRDERERAADSLVKRGATR